MPPYSTRPGQPVAPQRISAPNTGEAGLASDNLGNRTPLAILALVIGIGVVITGQSTNLHGPSRTRPLVERREGPAVRWSLPLRRSIHSAPLICNAHRMLTVGVGVGHTHLPNMGLCL